ncbi:GNAT family N-acetyltransferase [Carboxylicivirga sp. N1Y90]|uniref:GNAT family N-acetyltransferase n=1 Tax=Carboxylicivirga fragile TaxID=3417571 RepID=UPI003D3592E0|nr:GNAT family N-acetyltransferase [Marinilabiliaceae bacterium N1Y90]
MSYPIKSLTNIPLDTIFRAFGEAFKDYEIQLDKEGFRTMIQRRGFRPELSFAAFDDENIIAFTLNGIGNFNGKKTAYDTGTGTIKEYRGQGLATKIFEYSLPILKEEGIEQYLLEVLQRNTKAVSVYQKLGFKTTRSFNYFVQDMDKMVLKTKSLDANYQVHTITLSDIIASQTFFDFIPSWQNSFEAINRKTSDFIILGAFCEKQLIGYAILEPTSGDLTQIVIHPEHRRKGIASYLLGEALKKSKHSDIKIINTEENCNSINDFLVANAIPLAGKQYEMIRTL